MTWVIAIGVYVIGAGVTAYVLGRLDWPETAASHGAVFWPMVLVGLVLCAPIWIGFDLGQRGRDQ